MLNGVFCVKSHITQFNRHLMAGFFFQITRCFIGPCLEAKTTKIIEKSAKKLWFEGPKYEVAGSVQVFKYEFPIVCRVSLLNRRVSLQSYLLPNILLSFRRVRVC